MVVWGGSDPRKGSQGSPRFFFFVVSGAYTSSYREPPVFEVPKTVLKVPKKKNTPKNNHLFPSTPKLSPQPSPTQRTSGKPNPQ